MEEAKGLARVDPFLGCGLGYSGLLTVDKTYNSNMFIWFFPAECDPETAPVVVWLAGEYVSSFARYRNRVATADRNANQTD